MLTKLNSVQRFSVQEHEDNLNQSLSSGELSQFFHTLRRGDSPSPQDQSHDLSSTTVTDPVDSLETPNVYQFKGQPTELSDIYTTLPRKQRSKLSSPSPKSQVNLVRTHCASFET